jgi:hypothetical protein
MTDFRINPMADWPYYAGGRSFLSRGPSGNAYYGASHITQGSHEKKGT